MALETKNLAILELKAEADKRTISGRCSIKNNIDSYGDVIVDGAYSGLDETLKTGFICANHDHSTPIGYFTSIKEDVDGLVFEAEFHSTEDAVEWVTIVEERLAAGKYVGLSIGYKTLEYSYGEQEGRTVRYLNKILVKEATITLLPANEMAEVTGIKSRDDAFNEIVTSIIEYKARLEKIHALGRGESFQNRAMDELNQLKAAIDELQNTINSFVSEPEALGAEVDEQKTMSDAIAIAMAELEI